MMALPLCTDAHARVTAPARKAIVHPEAQSIAITQLTLENFRNYANLRLDIKAGSIVLTGANGAGKTNLLEAISMLTRAGACALPLSTNLSAMARRTAGRWRRRFRPRGRKSHSAPPMIVVRQAQAGRKMAMAAVLSSMGR